MNKKIIDPYWGNDDKTQVICTFEYEDGTSLTASVMNTPIGEDNNPDWDQIFKEHKKKDVNAITKAKLKIKDTIDDNIIVDTKANKEKRKNEDIFQAKIEAFQIEAVKVSKDRDLKSNIRKAKTFIEVAAYTAIIIMKSSENKTKT